MYIAHIHRRYNIRQVDIYTEIELCTWFFVAIFWRSKAHVCTAAVVRSQKKTKIDAFSLYENETHFIIWILY